MKDHDVSSNLNQQVKRDEIEIFKLNLKELIQTIEETQAKGDVLKDLIDSFVQFLPSSNLENFSKAIEWFAKEKPEYVQTLDSVLSTFKDHQLQNPKIKDEVEDFCKIADSKLCQIKIQIEEILDNWGNDPEGCKQAADSLMVDEKELRYVLSRMIANVDTSNSELVEALTSLNLYFQEQCQAPIKTRLEEESLIIDNALLVEFKAEIENILELWKLNPTHAKKAIEGLIQRNEEVFSEALLKITDENKQEFLTSLEQLHLYITDKEQSFSAQINEEDTPKLKKGFFSRFFGN